jgi:CubicO group peptidase (beta-lactamase class C family)
LSRVTVRELLTHSSGLSTPTGRAQWGWRFARPDSIAAGVRAITEADLTAAPGERFEYSNRSEGSTPWPGVVVTAASA